MKRFNFKLLVIFVICFFSNIAIINADTCSNEKINELKEKAKNIEIQTEFDLQNASIGIYNNYHISILGLTEEFYLWTNNQEKVFESYEAIDGTINSTITTNVKKIYVYSKECNNEIIGTIDVDLKKYNIYSEYEECQKIGSDNLKICSKFYDGELNDEIFRKEIEKYKKNLEQNNNTSSWLQKSYLIIAGAILIIAIGIISVVRYKKNKLD